MVMRRAGRWPERSASLQDRLDRRSPYVVVATGARQFGKWNADTREADHDPSRESRSASSWTP